NEPWFAFAAFVAHDPWPLQPSQRHRDHFVWNAAVNDHEGLGGLALAVLVCASRVSVYSYRRVSTAVLSFFLFPFSNGRRVQLRPVLRFCIASAISASE